MTIYFVLAFMALIVLLACFPSKEEVDSWRTPEGFRKQPRNDGK